MTYSLVIAAMLALVLFNNHFWNLGRCCPLCGGKTEHSRNCPQRDREGDE